MAAAALPLVLAYMLETKSEQQMQTLSQWRSAVCLASTCREFRKESTAMRKLAEQQWLENARKCVVNAVSIIETMRPFYIPLNFGEVNYGELHEDLMATQESMQQLLVEISSIEPAHRRIAWYKADIRAHSETLRVLHRVLAGLDARHGWSVGNLPGLLDMLPFSMLERVKIALHALSRSSVGGGGLARSERGRAGIRGVL
jgi:hypothetical protein